MEEIDKSMRINAPKGQKVNFMGPREGLWGGGFADGKLEVGNTYTVAKTMVFKSHSLVSLAEVPENEFNTVMFEETGEVLEPLRTTEELYRKGVEVRDAEMRKNRF